MKERPVLFNGDMVRAILDGRKTQTRRMVKPQRSGPAWTVKPTQEPRYARHSHDWWLPTGTIPYSALPSCPYGAVGDRLWVRETFGDCGSRLVYRADSNDGASCSVKRWVPSIHMPRDACRLVLEITGVRVERLTNISEEDAKAEGVGSATWFAANGVPEDKWESLGEHGALQSSHINRFATLWESIYGAESWKANPWCWVIEFKVVRDGN
jgi:hypothetical protein